MAIHTKPNKGETNTWLTPEWLIKALGPFDLDPCAAPSPRPWDTAKMYYELPQDGLALPWCGAWCVPCGPVTEDCLAKAHTVIFSPATPYRVFMNPPYGNEVGAWLAKLAAHGSGIALVAARTETAVWHKHVWPKAHSIFFFDGRLYFHRPNGDRGRSSAGFSSVLISYSYSDTCSIELARETGLTQGTLVKDWIGRRDFNA